ncbi:tat (twin-arginine translocation) pathway signal sequence [Candidatus Magnetomorum sp. HK-1]|nr:tat (twin-arginine translocation) pathway signal sequence [Candidatus Magnetomorum sp. HK-1]
MKRPFDRREFLKYQFKGFLWLAGAGSLFQSNLFASAVPDISVVKGKPGPAVRSAVELLGGMSRFVKKGNKVVIKPNMSFPVPPERASNTHPEVVRTIAEMCKEAGASRVLILDNPLAPPDVCLNQSGILDACKSVDDKMVHMVSKSSSFKKTVIPNAESLTSTDIMKDVLSADVLIAAPVAKSHSGAAVSLSMKGMMGLIYDRKIMHRMDLHSSIVDLASILKPNLVVVDATRVLTTGGPRGPGKVLKKDTVIASADMVAADAFTVSSFEWYGKSYRPDQVAHIRIAHKRGLGRMDINNLNIKKIQI